MGNLAPRSELPAASLQSLKNAANGIPPFLRLREPLTSVGYRFESGLGEPPQEPHTNRYYDGLSDSLPDNDRINPGIPIIEA
ncbi:MAG: hypothetical protein US52_C0018G0006 [candidate division WS6 bacterium GW2011_GWA2_37_6]|uniref:Uncharacterized protein n=1 Tax=candidate division WS6 bacterium GW2011_GWA2_37_6 TaxID=1619087 RepID=A0A0G0GXH9_9BACT|nr:MAG: hypothetical protein US52_C0018G0006 [candidate division WS6 bacterium GW2011_GWA2_37_6]